MTARTVPAKVKPVAMPINREVARIPEAIPFLPGGAAPSIALLLGVAKIDPPRPVTASPITTR